MFKLFFKPKFKALCLEYLKLQESRHRTDEIVKSTYDEYVRKINDLISAFGDYKYHKISVSDIQDFLDDVSMEVSAGKARKMRMIFIDVYREAARRNLISLGHNPAEVTRTYKINVVRRRINIDEFIELRKTAKKIAPPWFLNALDFAFIVGQRRADITLAHEDHVFDGLLHIAQHKSRRQKTRQRKIALPLSLYNELLDVTLGEFIHKNSKGWIINRKGQEISPWSVTKWFRICWDQTHGPSIDQPCFHELRSLSERYYSEQGLQTKNLLGHKNQATTDLYNDNRGADWDVLRLPENMKRRHPQ